MPDYPDVTTMLDREYDLDEKYVQSLPLCDRCGCRILSEKSVHPPETDLLFCEECGLAYIDDMWVLTENYVG
jgi:hypothetical protein